MLEKDELNMNCESEKSVNEMKTSLHTHFTQEGKKKISKTNFKT